MIALESVKWLQVEATTKCNAWCPGCTRNNNGFGLADNLTIEDLSTSRFAEILESLPNLETIDFCGTFGDAIAAENILELTELAKAHSKYIMVRTNGSLRNIEWWKNYANALKNHKHNIWFCLDGLADTHSIYRQATSWDKIIDNAKAFINAGGYATWQFIPWAHNEHQIKECLKLSQDLGFKEFKLLTKVRSNFDARDYRTGESYQIVNWSRNNKTNSLVQKEKEVTVNQCMHLSFPSLYLNANGKLNVCCFFNIHHAHQDPHMLMDVQHKLNDKILTPQICRYHCGSVAQ